MDSIAEAMRREMKVVGPLLTELNARLVAGELQKKMYLAELVHIFKEHAECHFYCESVGNHPVAREVTTARRKKVQGIMVATGTHDAVQAGRFLDLAKDDVDAAICALRDYLVYQRDVIDPLFRDPAPVIEMLLRIGHMPGGVDRMGRPVVITTTTSFNVARAVAGSDGVDPQANYMRAVYFVFCRFRSYCPNDVNFDLCYLRYMRQNPEHHIDMDKDEKEANRAVTKETLLRFSGQYPGWVAKTVMFPVPKIFK